MSLKHLSSPELWSNTVRLAQEEKRIGIEILWHMREIDRRRLHLERGFSSLHEFLVRELKYSDGAADRRIKSMRLLRELPELEQSIAQGSLSMTTVSLAQNFFQAEKKPYSLEEKRALLNQFENRSKSECQRILVSISPQAARPEQVRPINSSDSEVRFTASRELMEKFERLKAYSGETSLSLLFEKMADSLLKTYEKKTGVPQQERASPEKRVEKRVEKRAPRPYRPVKTTRAVFAQANHQCSFVDERTGRRCASRFALQVDHRLVYALGGSEDAENLRLLCRAHNQHEAIRAFGEKWMGRFVSTAQ